jgi:hypothetical protein
LSNVQAHLLKRIATLEQHVAGSPDASKILPRLDNLRTAIGEMTSRYDARLTEVKARNQQALSALRSLSERLERVKHVTSTSEPTECGGSDVKAESPGHFSFSHEATRDFSFGDVGGELCSDVASSAEMSFMSPGMYWCDSASVMAPNQWDMDSRTPNPPEATVNDDSDGGIRTPSPEWSPRGCLLRRVPFPVQPATPPFSPAPTVAHSPVPAGVVQHASPQILDTAPGLEG